MSHIIILIIIAVIVIPPEKLPEVARQIAKFLNDLRRSTSGIWDDIKKDAVVKPDDLFKPDENIKNPDQLEINLTEKIDVKKEEKKHE